MKNEGKKFEEDFKKSVPDDVYFLRLQDAGGWSNADNTRFTVSNICDAIMYKVPFLHMIELKSHKGKSIPFSCIREKQLLKLAEADNYNGVAAWFIFNFRDAESTYAVRATKLIDFMSNTDRKSIPIDFCAKKGIVLPAVKKRTRWRYYLRNFMNEY